MKNEQHHFNLVSRLKDETSVFVRPLHPGDKACMQAGYQCLSKRSRYYRFLHYQSLLSDEQLKYFTEIDYINHFALGAVLTNQMDKGIGIGRYIRIDNEPNVAELALVVIDDYQNKGLGTLFINILSHVASHNHIDIFRGYLLEENRSIRSFLKRFNATITWEGGPLLRADIPLPVPNKQSELIKKAFGESKIDETVLV